MKLLMKHIQRFWDDESAATAIEYALIVALISVAAIWAMRNLGYELEATFRTIAREIRRARAGI